MKLCQNFLFVRLPLQNVDNLPRDTQHANLKDQDRSTCRMQNASVKCRLIHFSQDLLVYSRFSHTLHGKSTVAENSARIKWWVYYEVGRLLQKGGTWTGVNFASQSKKQHDISSTSCCPAARPSEDLSSIFFVTANFHWFYIITQRNSGKCRLMICSDSAKDSNLPIFLPTIPMVPWERGQSDQFKSSVWKTMKTVHSYKGLEPLRHK